MDGCTCEGWYNEMTTITLKGIIDEDFVNYKHPSMTLMFPTCTFKCEHDCGQPVCQNSSIVKQPDIEVNIDKLCERYINNKISRAIVCQGLEPFDSFDELLSFIAELRIKYQCDDDIVIYTGYNSNEIQTYINILRKYKNIIVKFGRYIPDSEEVYDSTLGVKLASSNQYAVKIS